MLEYGRPYKLTKNQITSKLNEAGTDLEDDSDPVLTAGTRFVVFDRNEWNPYSEGLKLQGLPSNFYAIRLEAEEPDGPQYLVLAHRLEADSRPAD